jgi:hypothetical protein
VLVRVGQSEQVTPWSASSAWRSTEENVKLMRYTMHFDLPRSNVQDRSTQIVLEVHDANGLHSSVSLPVWKVARGDDTHGNFPSMLSPLPETDPGCTSLEGGFRHVAKHQKHNTFPTMEISFPPPCACNFTFRLNARSCARSSRQASACQPSENAVTLSSTPPELDSMTSSGRITAVEVNIVMTLPDPLPPCIASRCNKSTNLRTNQSPLKPRDPTRLGSRSSNWRNTQPAKLTP